MVAIFNMSEVSDFKSYSGKISHLTLRPASWVGGVVRRFSALTLSIVTNAWSLAAEPPSYDSLFGRIRDTHKASRNVIDFVVRVIILLLGTIGCTIACSITIVIPVCMIVIGSVYFHDCPAEPYIPIFLIVGGDSLN